MTAMLKRKRSRKRPKRNETFLPHCLWQPFSPLAKPRPVMARRPSALHSQKTGTFAWELAVIRAHGLDKQADLSIEVIELASPEAGKIALRAGTPTS